MKVKDANSWEEVKGMAVTEILTKDRQGHKSGESMTCRVCGFRFVGYNRERFWYKVESFSNTSEESQKMKVDYLELVIAFNVSWLLSCLLGLTIF